MNAVACGDACGTPAHGRNKLSPAHTVDSGFAHEIGKLLDQAGLRSLGIVTITYPIDPEALKDIYRTSDI